MPTPGAVDQGAGVYLTATWAAPEVLIPAPVAWSYLTSAKKDATNGNPLVLDVKGQQTTPGTPVEVWDFKGTDNGNQLWTYVSDLYLQGQQSGLYLEVADAGDGATVQINNFTGALNQQWSICGDAPPIGNDENPTNQVWQSDFSPTLDCDYLVTVTTNNTLNDFNVSGDPTFGTDMIYSHFPAGTPQNFPAGSVAVFVTAWDNDNSMGVEITDSNSDFVASYYSHQDDCYLKAGDVSANNAAAAAGYSMNIPSSGWYRGAYNSVPGICVASVDYSGS